MKHAPASARKLISRAKLTSLVAKLAKRRVTLSAAPVIDLSPRYPYKSADTNMNFYDLYSWRTFEAPNGVIAMHKHIPGQPGHGEVTFTITSSGTYVIVANFQGQGTFTLDGPWGVSSATGTWNRPAAVLGLLTVVSGGPTLFGCEVYCTSGDGVWFLGIQVFSVV
jgi:hypothetical protein